MGWWTTPRPGRPTRRKEPVPIVYEAGWAPGPVWTGAENLAPPGPEPRTTQPVASRYTDWAIPAGPHTQTHEDYGQLSNRTVCRYTDDWCGLLAAAWNRPFGEGECSSAGPLHFVEPEGSLPCPWQPLICPMLSQIYPVYAHPLYGFKLNTRPVYLNQCLHFVSLRT